MIVKAINYMEENQWSFKSLALFIVAVAVTVCGVVVPLAILLIAISDLVLVSFLVLPVTASLIIIMMIRWLLNSWGMPFIGAFLKPETIKMDAIYGLLLGLFYVITITLFSTEEHDMLQNYILSFECAGGECNEKMSLSELALTALLFVTVVYFYDSLFYNLLIKMAGPLYSRMTFAIIPVFMMIAPSLGSWNELLFALLTSIASLLVFERCRTLAPIIIGEAVMLIAALLS